ncbi:MAG: hypothetical protein ISR55_04570 [Bacteroidetes bacterium]|nr:hypothetical protein [Bacteroidota bacterium]
MLSTVYPHWFILLCIFTAAIFAVLLYYKNYFRTGKSMFSYPSWIMLITRFIVIALISFFLLSPFLKKNFRKDEKPLLIMAVDNSSSILLNKDSLYYTKTFHEDILELKEQLKSKYNLAEYTFGSRVRPGINLDFKDPRTNMYELLDHIYEQNANKNMGAIIIASDGNYNDGRDPMVLVNDFRTPFYTIALGDTTPAADLIIKEVRHNQIAYLGNVVPIRISVNAEKFKNSNIELSLTNNKRVIKNWTTGINHDNFSQTIDYQFDAKESGLQHFQLRIKEKDGEISFVNNYKDFYIDVLESRKHIIVIANSPHPDINALRHSIGRNDNYKLESVLAENLSRDPNRFQDQLKNADLLILHQLPSNEFPLYEQFANFELNKTPLLLILGSQVSFQKLNNLNLGIKVQHRNNAFEQVYAVPNSAFSYFSLNEKLKPIIQDFPPLFSPFGKYSISLEHEVLFSQKIGQVKSPYPLMVFMQDVDKRIGVICGEGIWRWPLAEYRIKNQQDFFNDLVLKSIQYISIKEDRRYFRLKDFSGNFYEDQSVIVGAELYNKSYEKLQGAKISLDLFHEGNEMNFQFIETDDGYRANLGYLKAGKYAFRAATLSSGSKQQINGEFMVKKVELEFIRTLANHQLLYNIAEENNGEMIYPDQLSDIENLIDQLDLKNRTSFEIESRDLIELKWLFFLIIALLTAEWFFRKFFGSY